MANADKIFAFAEMIVFGLSKPGGATWPLSALKKRLKSDRNSDYCTKLDRRIKVF